MSKYTMELRTVVEYYGKEEVESWFTDYEISDYLTDTQASLVKKTGIWDKNKLAKKIVDHYYMREIGFETPGLFKHYAKVYMREIMERQLPVIYSASIEYDPTTNVNYTESMDRNVDNTSGYGNTSTSNASGLAVNSDTPQGQINKQAILQGEYASSTGASESTSSVSDSGSTEGNVKEVYTKTFKGNMGITATYQELIKQYRKVIVAVDEEIIKELNKLFMGLY